MRACSQQNNTPGRIILSSSLMMTSALLPKSGGPWRRREGGRSDNIAVCNRHNVLPLRVASDHFEFRDLVFVARAMSEGALNSAAPFRFAFLSAFSVPRSEHPRPSDARSPFSKSAMRLRRCGLLPPGKLWSLSTDSVKSPREWVATAHPSGKLVPQTAD